MSSSVTKAGPYFSSGSISFSSLRNTFKEISSGSVKASELRRNTNTSEKNPIVPDATENSSISIFNDLKISQFRNTIKYYYITQTGTDQNLDIDALSWNSNLNKTIKKWFYIQGILGSNTTSNAAADLNATVYNLIIDVSGQIYGAGGSGGTSSTISGGNGGTALSISNSTGSNLVVNVQSSGKIYGGGGGGEKGATGANGSAGTCINTTTTQGCGGKPGCPSGYYETGQWSGGCCQSYSYCCGLFNCGCEACSQYLQGRYCRQEYLVPGGLGGEGGNGGPGRGYNNFSGSLIGSNGLAGGPNNGCGSTDGEPGGVGGAGGEWGLPGESTANSGTGGSAGYAINGNNYSLTGSTGSDNIKGLGAASTDISATCIIQTGTSIYGQGFLGYLKYGNGDQEGTTNGSTLFITDLQSSYSGVTFTNAGGVSSDYSTLSSVIINFYLNTNGRYPESLGYDYWIRDFLNNSTYTNYTIFTNTINTAYLQGEQPYQVSKGGLVGNYDNCNNKRR